MRRFLVAAAGMAASGSAAAGQLSITFEELGQQPNIFASTTPLRNQIPGATFTGPSNLDGGAIVNVTGNWGVQAHSGEHFLGFNRAARMMNGGRPIDPETVTFDETATAVSIWAAGGFDVDSFAMEAFDSGGVSLGAAQAAGRDWVEMRIDARGIKSIRLTATSGDGAWIYDDLQTEGGCYPDCDTSTGPGVLDIFDFLCFQNRYSAGAPYACDCDTSTGPGVCDIFDFLCFQNAFDAGCP